MQLIKSSIVAILIIFFLASCEDVIEVDLDDAEQKLVVEAVILDSLGGNYVKVSKSAGFYDSNDFESVSNANIEVVSSQGDTFLLSEAFPGHYSNPLLGGEYGTNYKLKVSVNGLQTVAHATMPSEVVYDSLVVEENIVVFGGEGEFRVRVYFTDPVSERNFYRMKIYLNGFKEELTALLDDGIINGKSTSFPIFFYGYDSGNIVTVELFSISEDMYKYYNALADNVDGGFFTAAPGNPDNNFDADVLGYFTCYSVKSKTVVIP